jgi:hypothetical protein
MDAQGIYNRVSILCGCYNIGGRDVLLESRIWRNSKIAYSLHLGVDPGLGALDLSQQSSVLCGCGA